MLHISDNHRYLVHEDGRPFFYLADTAWELFHRLTREEAEHYLTDRASKGFTAIQAVVLAELDGLCEPNAYGHLPLHDFDPTKPNEDYFEHVDWIVARAAALGLHTAMLPTWGDKWLGPRRKDPKVFTVDNARVFGRFLGERYRDQPIIWVLGGDRWILTYEHADIVRAMAAGLEAGDGGTHLKTFHPPGQQGSSWYFQCDRWLDFNMYQTGHTIDRDCYRSVTADFWRTPTKPCLDGEPGYENHPSGFNVKNPRMDAYDCRKFLYWDLFAGACGHTYGCHDIWQFWQPGRKPITGARTPWREALHLPGAGQMQWGRKLIEAGPYFDRVPDLSLLESGPYPPARHVQVCRGEQGNYILAYLPEGGEVQLKTSDLSGSSVHAQWFDPRTDEFRGAPSFVAGQSHFTAPTQGPGQDWVLVVAG